MHIGPQAGNRLRFSGFYGLIKDAETGRKSFCLFSGGLSVLGLPPWGGPEKALRGIPLETRTVIMELWDLYDEHRRPLGRTHPRGVPVPEGTYHLAVVVVIVNSRGEVLLTRRAPAKAACPGWWENTGGAVQAGETPLQAVCRELREETGLTAAPEEFTLLLREDCRMDCHFDIFALTRDAAVEDIRFQPEETDAARWEDRRVWEAIAGTGTTLCPAWREEYKQELYRRLEEYLQGRREFSEK